MKKWIPRRALLAALVFLILTAPAGARADVTVRTLLSGMDQIVPVEGARQVLVYSATTDQWKVYSTSGEQVFPEQYYDLAYCGFGCYETCYDPDPLQNWKALVAPDGSLISGFRYGVFMVYNRYWAAGWQVSAGTESEYDYSPEKGTYYNIDWCDVFWLGDSPSLVGQLPGEQFLRAQAHEWYLSVEDRDGGVTVYDRDFQPTGFPAEIIQDSPFGLYNLALRDLVTGEILLDGVSACKEFSTPRGVLFQITRVNYSGVKQYGVCDALGQWLMPLGDFGVVSLNGDYAVISQDGRRGLYSFERGRVIVPCEYDSLVSSALSADAYVFYGYACGVKGGVRCYVDVETGQVANELEYNARAMKSIGGTVYETVVTDTYRVTAANGAQWMRENIRLEPTRGDGRLLVFFDHNAQNYGILTMDGDVALPFLYRNCPVITDDGRVVLETVNDGFSLLELLW